MERRGTSIIGWLVLGLVAGFIASRLYRGSGQGVVLGIVGAIVGGFLFSLVGVAPITGFNLYSMVVAIIGAVVALWIYHAVAGRRTLR